MIIIGAGFGSPAADKYVTFNGIPAVSYSTWTDTQISALVGANATTGHVVVNLSSGNTVTGPTFTVTTPTVTGISLDNGPIGTVFTVQGTNLGQFGFDRGDHLWTWVTVNDVPVAHIHDAWSPTAINNVELAANATIGLVKVLIHANTMGFNTVGLPVVTGEATITATGPTFTVTTPTVTGITLDNGSIGTVFTVQGTNLGQFHFDRGNHLWTWVTVNDVPVAHFHDAWSPTAINNVELAGNATSGVVKVLIHATNTDFDGSGFPIVTSETTLTVAGPTFTVTTPTIASISPTIAPIGTLITVNGANFGQTPQTVLFNTVSGSLSAWSNGLIQATIPNGIPAGQTSITVQLQATQTGFDETGFPTTFGTLTITSNTNTDLIVGNPSTDTPTATLPPTNTPRPTITATDTLTNTPVPMDTNTPTPLPTNTPTFTDTPVPTNTSTNTPSATLLPTNTPMSSDTPTSTDTPTPVPSYTPTFVPPTNIPTSTNTPIPTSTNTPVPSNTPTSTLIPPTNTPTSTPIPPTRTPTPTNTLVPPSNTPTNTPVPPTATPNVLTVAIDIKPGSYPNTINLVRQLDENSG